jgi:hypothetical protein
MASVDHLTTHLSGATSHDSSLFNKMTFIVENATHFTPSFVAVAKTLGGLQKAYVDSRDKALRIRMEMIGRAEQEKTKYSQRSPEACYIQEGYKANGWTEDVIKKNKAAWEQYKSFRSNVNPEVQVIAEQSSVSQLYELSLDRTGSMWWDAMKYLQRHRSMPTVKQLRGYRGGFTDHRFKFRCRSRSLVQEVAPLLAPGPPEVVKPKAAPPIVEAAPDPQLLLPVSTKAYDLAITLQGVVDQLLDIQPQWEGDHRVMEVVDAQRLNDLTARICLGRDTGWDF